MSTPNLIRVNGTSLHYEDCGGGNPILFSHGLLWNTTMFRKHIAALCNEFRCVAYDHRGQGKSADDQRNEIDVETLADDAAALIRELNLGPVHFVGHSLGGFVGLRLALSHPELVRSLVLCSTSADEEPRSNRRRYRMLNLAARWLGPRRIAGALMPIMHGRHALQDSARRSDVATWREQVASNRRSIWRAANGVINRKSMRDELERIDIPTLVLVGEFDNTRTLEEGQRIASGIQGAKLMCIPHAGHMLPLEEPDAVVQAIRQFCEQR